MEQQPVREIRPEVVPAQFLLLAPLCSLGGALFPAFFVFVLSNILTGFSSEPFQRMSQGPVVGYAILAYCIAAGVILWLCYVKFYLEPGRTKYAIYTDRVEYDEGLFNRQRRTVIYDQVLDIEMTEGMLQQTRAVGTVTLITQQLIAGQNGQLANRRVSMVNVPKPREVYDLLRSLAMKDRK